MIHLVTAPTRHKKWRSWLPDLGYPADNHRDNLPLERWIAWIIESCFNQSSCSRMCRARARKLWAIDCKDPKVRKYYPCSNTRVILASQSNLIFLYHAICMKHSLLIQLLVRRGCSINHECNIAMVVSRDLDPTIGWMIATVVISRLEGAVAPTSPPQPAPSPPPPS